MNHSTGMIECLLYYRYIEHNYDSYWKLPFQDLTYYIASAIVTGLKSTL